MNILQAGKISCKVTSILDTVNSNFIEIEPQTVLSLLENVKQWFHLKILWLQTTPIYLAQNQYGCPFCSKLLKSSWLMKRHILTHTEERPYSCPYCNYSMKRKYNLKAHMAKCRNSWIEIDWNIIFESSTFKSTIFVCRLQFILDLVNLVALTVL